MGPPVDAGVNFFDNAEAYAGGESERIMGEAIAELGWERHSYVVSTKFFWGIHDGPTCRNTLNRKYLMQAIDGSLERFGLDFVDLIFCHRPTPRHPIEETVWAMSDIVRGKALYWGTSEWSADEIRAAWEIAERHHLHKPVMEQPQYNLFERRKVEKEYARLYEDIGLGPHHLEPAGLGPAHRQVPRRHPRGQPGHAARATSGSKERAHRRGRDATPRSRASGRRRGARLHPRAAGHRLVRQEPERVHGDHRRQPGRAGPREHGALDVLRRR
jgi:aryl-alcohol dehydrogenase-like predicted oxidoreductase